VAKELGQPEEAARFWRQVHLAASDKPVVWLYIAQYGEKIGDLEEAAKAWRRLTQDPHLGHAAYEALIRLGEREGNTRTLREIMRQMAKAYPDEPEPRNDFAYLNGLLSEDLAAAKEAAKRLVADNPTFLAYRTTLALALWRLNETEAAAALYDGIELDWGTVLPGWQAVRVAVLGGAGKTNLARIAAKRIPLNNLKPEERALLRPYL
jgi:tetratricopeptide (TPR) repeat protein